MKRIFGLIVVVIIVIIFSACSQAKTFDFPITEEIMLDELQKAGLDWKIEKSTSFDDEHMNFMFVDGDGIIISLDTRGNESERFIGVGTFYGSAVTGEQKESFTNNVTPKIFDLICSVYGVENSNKIYLQFDDYAEQYKDEKELKPYVIWTKRDNNNHFYLALRPFFNKKEACYELGIIRIVNTAAYEEGARKIEEGWEKIVKCNGEEELKELSVKEYIELYEQNNLPEMFKIKGKIKRLKGNEADTSETIKRISVGAIEKVILSDESEETEIMIMPSTLTDKELMEERCHLIWLYNFHSENFYPVIQKSVRE